MFSTYYILELHGMNVACFLECMLGFYVCLFFLDKAIDFLLANS
jgi:hypothetical protein